VPTARLLRIVTLCALALVGARVTVAAPEACGSASPSSARAAARSAAQWLAANQQPDGSYLYAADSEGRDLGGYSSVRHAGVTLSLYQAANALDDEQLRDAADRGLRWMTDRLAARDDWVALADGSSAPLGGSALMLAALAERRVLTGDDAHDDTMRALGRFLVSMQRDNGDFYVSSDVDSGEPDRTTISQYFASEALWALARLHRALPADTWRDTVERAAHFVATERNDRDFVPVGPLNDHWAAYGFAEMADWPLGEDEARYARALAGRFHLLIRWEAGKGSGAPYEWTHAPDRSAAALGTWVEGQAALARLARADDRLADLRSETLASARCGAGVLAQRQHRGSDVRLAGAWFTDGMTRMDGQQHAISGLLAVAHLQDREES
jgi:hypothetical protein